MKRWHSQLRQSPAKLATAASNLRKSHEFLDAAKLIDVDQVPGLVAECCAHAMNQAAWAYLIAKTGDAPYKVAELIVAFVDYIKITHPKFTGFGEDISFAYTLRTVSVYDVVYRARKEQALDLLERAERMIAFVRQETGL